MQKKFRQPHIPKSLYNIDQEGHRHRIYHQNLKGMFINFRKWTAFILIIIYLGMPWLTLNGLPLIHLNIPDRQFVLFGSVFWPQDFQYLMLIAILATLILFSVTALLGRIWCGWACPQTVFLEFVIRKIEYWVEGKRIDQIKLDKSPWSLSKITKKSIKHILFILVAAIVSNTFLSYFTSVETLLYWISRPPWENWTAFLFMMFFLSAFYFDLAFFQEQFCVLVCPYARFQSVMVDSQTIQVVYDPIRGEPRGPKKKTEGDCIDCDACIRACPTGIDIRNGSQLECIGCARCIDVCDRIMTRIDKPKGLIRYDSEQGLGHKKTSIIRPRIILYAFFLILLTGGLVWALVTRPLVDYQLLKPKGAPYTMIAEDLVSNNYSLRLINKDLKGHHVKLKQLSGSDVRLIVPVSPFRLKPNTTSQLAFFIIVEKGNVQNGHKKILLQVIIDDVNERMIELNFLGPS